MTKKEYNHMYYLLNKEKLKTQNQERYSKNKDYYVKKQRQYYKNLDENTKRLRQKKEIARTKNKCENDFSFRLLKNSRNSANRKMLAHTIQREDIFIPKICPVLGIRLFFSKTKTDNTPTVDRIDNSKGYVKNNIRIISWRANNLKSDATPEEMICIGKDGVQLKNYLEKSQTP